MRKLKPVEAQPTDAVVLIPGFIGFSRIGRFYYFSERISAALRIALEARLGRPVVVEPCSTEPIDSLEARQACLLQQLQRLCGELPSVRRLHLVGHSAGGLDAQLLTCDRPIAEDSWRAYDREHDRKQGPSYGEVRRRIASVVAISAPQHGTFLSRSRAALFLADPRRYYDGFGAFARVAVNIVPLALFHPALADLVAGLGRQLPEALAFLRRMRKQSRLIAQLDPELMAELRARVRPEGRVPLTSFVTVAGLSKQAPKPPDPFFYDLYNLIADHARPIPPVVPTTLDRLHAHRDLIAGETTLELRSIAPTTNDGVVPSGLQLLDPADPAELGGIIVGDHADVIGHYDRKPAHLDDEPLNVGVFHSGSGFSDDAFFELYRRVVDAIARAIP